LVLFYVAGIAALTLIINGSLCGYLVSALGLDRQVSTTAETEVFTRACSAIEARLEHKLDLLKGDRFLGDADWEMVWRYLPVSTSKMYWHRIRHGNINLSVEEEEDIHMIRDGIVNEAGLHGDVAFRAHQVHKWFTRRILRLPGGVGYCDLPSRLRVTWYTYHKKFHHSSATGDDNQHRKDMELQRLNAEPRMMLEAEAWSNLNARDDPDTLLLPNQTPVSHTLRKHLDNVGMLGFQDESGMMSDFGQREIAKQAAGAKSGTLFGNGRGGAEALRMVEGVNKLKEERRRARQAVAKAEARLSRLNKDMTISRHKGLEEDMKEYMKQVREGGMLGHASIHGGACFTNRKGAPSGGGSSRPYRGGDLDDEKQPESDDDDDDDDDNDDDDEEEEEEEEEEGGVDGDGHEVKAKTEVAPEWNPYEDSDDEDGTNKPGLSMGHRRKRSRGGPSGGSTDGGEGEGGRTGGSAITSGALTMGSMSEARVRFLTAVKAHFTARYHQGWLSSMGLRVLKENMDSQLDHDELEMDQWSHLSTAFRLPRSMAILRKIPLVGK
ncbi:unnamed protein product, partial [Ectocarpus sp. 8 AP-2014]